MKLSWFALFGSGRPAGVQNNFRPTRGSRGDGASVSIKGAKDTPLVFSFQENNRGFHLEASGKTYKDRNRECTNSTRNR